MLSNHLIFCLPFSFCLQSFPASESSPGSQLFASGGQSIGASTFSSSPSNEYSGLISFRTNWFDLLAVQGTLKSLLAHFSSTYTKIGTVQRRLAWPLCKDDMQIYEVIHIKKKVFFSTTVQKHQFFGVQLLYGPTLNICT